MYFISFQNSQNSFVAKLESLNFLLSIIFLEKGFCCWHTEIFHVPKGEQIDWKERWPGADRMALSHCTELCAF